MGKPRTATTTARAWAAALAVAIACPAQAGTPGGAAPRPGVAALAAGVGAAYGGAERLAGVHAVRREGRLRVAGGAREPGQWRGRRYHNVALRWSRALELVCWVDPQSGYVVRADGLVFPYREEVFAAGRPAGATRMDSIEINPVSIGPFRPPASGELF